MSLATWQFTLLALPQTIATAFAAFTAAVVWRWRGEARGARWLTGVLAGATWWSAMGVLELLSIHLETKILFSQLSYLGILASPLCFAEFAHRYLHDGRGLPRRWAHTLRWTAALLGLLVATQGSHHQLWPAVYLVDRDTLVTAYYGRGVLFWVVVVYAYGVLLTGAFALARHALAVGGIFRLQTWLIIGATVAPLISSLTYLLRLGPLPELDHTPLGFIVTGLLLTWAVHRVRLFDLVPVAANTLFERMRDPLVLTDLSGRLIQLNPMAMRRLKLGPEAIGQPLHEVIDSLPLRNAFTLAAQQPQTVQVGNTWWDIEASHLRDQADNRRARLFVLRNITRQKTTEQELRETTRGMREALSRADELAQSAHDANAAKTKFLAQVSHDLRTPLHGIIGMTELMTGRYEDPRLREEIGTIHEAGESLLRLINELLDLSRIEAGRIDLADQPFLLDDVLDPVADLLTVAAERKGLVLLTCIAPDLDGGLRGDPDRFRQIITNLAGNAVKFTSRGHVMLRASRGATGRLRLDITDTGPGIANDRLATVFEAFDRGNPEVARDIEGTGLGLAITRRLVEAMAGEIHASSTPGRGTTFRVELPLLDSSAIPADCTELAATLSGRRVAIAASVTHPALRDCLAEHLRGLGAELVTTAGKNDLIVGLDTPASGPATPAYRQVRLPFKRRQLAALLRAAAPADAPIAAPTGDRPETQPTRKTLLADDDALARRVSCALLQRAGCAVTAVAGGHAAISALGATAFELIVLDGQMGDIDGWDVAAHLRKGRAGELNRDTPIIALSADLTAEAKQRWQDGGVNAFLPKPLQVDKLQTCLDALPPAGSASPPAAS